MNFDSLGLSPASAAVVDEKRRAARRTGLYGSLAVAVQFTGNAVHLWSKAATVSPSALPSIVAEALFGPVIVLICSHLLMHAAADRPLEVWPLRIGFVAGAALSAVHLWAIAHDVLGSPWLAALLPLGVECAAIGSIQQFARTREDLERFAADLAQSEAAEAAIERKARQDADDAARRAVQVERAEAERLVAEGEAEQLRIEAETEKERVLLAERKATADAVVKARKTAGRTSDTADTETAVAVFLAAHASDRGGKGPALKTVADALGVTTRTVQRCDAWSNRASLPSTETASSVEAAVLLGVASTNNGTHEMETV